MSPNSYFFGLAFVFCLALSACASAPKSNSQPEDWVLRPTPEGVFMGKPERAFKTVGTVRTWQGFPTSLDDSFTETEFNRRCRKAFYEASGKLLGIAREHGAEAVVEVNSVVFLADGRKEYHPKAEC
ncbi:hypothetical protein EBZ37_01580, partial [bacterium]|nr:hypothetical protein [bacterium]